MTRFIKRSRSNLTFKLDKKKKTPCIIYQLKQVDVLICHNVLKEPVDLSIARIDDLYRSNDVELTEQIIQTLNNFETKNVHIYVNELNNFLKF